MRCQLNRLQKGQMIDEWFPLSSHIPLKGIEPGSLRVRARYSVEKIMPEEEYSDLKEARSNQDLFWDFCLYRQGSHSVLFGSMQMILQKDFHVIYALAHVCGQDRSLLASLLLRIFRHEKAEAPLLRTLNDREINMEGKTCRDGFFWMIILASLLPSGFCWTQNIVYKTRWRLKVE